MKKILFTFLLCFTGILIMKAECSYKELKELNAFASHVETSYKYNEETGLFDLTVTNLGDKAYVSDQEGTYFEPSNGEAFIDKIMLGQTYKINIYSNNNTNCPRELLRVIYVRIPYKNPYYMNSGCVGHENLSVCNSQFLDYQLSWETFLGLLKRDTKTEVKNSDNTDIKDDKVSFWEKTINFLSEIYIKVILVVVTTILSISVYSIILRKVKHGL